MKKIIFLFLILAISIISFSGCNSNTNNQNKENKDNSSENNAASQTNKNINQPLVVLFCGISLDEKDMRIPVFDKKFDAEKIQEIYNKYEREYYLYSDGALIGQSNGKIEERGLDYSWDISFGQEFDNKVEVAISKQFNPYPRQITNISSDFNKEFEIDGKVFKAVNNQFNVSATIREITKVDIDGEGKDEYIALAVDEQSYFFAKCLIDSDFNVVAYLTVFKGKPQFADFDRILKYKYPCEIIDIDNDGVMEILLSLPTYEGFEYRIFKYKNRVFDGPFITRASVDN